MHKVYAKCCRIEGKYAIDNEDMLAFMQSEIAELRDTMLDLAKKTGWKYEDGYSRWED